MGFPVRLEVPVTAYDGRGNTKTLSPLVYVLERTCTVSSSYYVTDEYAYIPCTYYSYELSCGHEVNWADEEPPNYCPECGAKVVE